MPCSTAKIGLGSSIDKMLPDLGSPINLDFALMKDLATIEALPGYTGDFALAIPVLAFFAYQMMFAVITPALITGATADRLKFSAYAILIGVWAILVYPTVAHWVFSPNGWLFKKGALDWSR